MDENIAKATGSLINTIQVPNNQYTGMYMGTVINNEDKEYHRGRCKVYIPGVYPEDFIENRGEHLPWAIPCQPLFCGGSGYYHNNGMFQCPDLGSTVCVMFINNDILKPIIFGQITDYNGKFYPTICKMYWEGMSIEMDKSTNTVTISGDNIRLYCDTANLSARKFYISSDVYVLGHLSSCNTSSYSSSSYNSDDNSTRYYYFNMYTSNSK